MVVFALVLNYVIYGSHVKGGIGAVRDMLNFVTFIFV